MDDRHALVIGNSKYLTTPLPNPANDARLMAKELQSVGFNVRLVIDGTRDQMIKAINDFQFELSHHSQGVGLFYYAGHGIQVDGSNYLVPVNAHLMRAEDTEVEAVNLNLVLARMDSSNSRFKFVILDACRNNPFPGVGRTIGRGLAFVSAPTGTLIAYATAPGDVAADGESGHSPFTSALARELHRPGEEIGNTLKSVRAAVQTATRGKQTPWESTSIVGDFYFVEK
jgi:uncharacterized caspase-like protein